MRTSILVLSFLLTFAAITDVAAQTADARGTAQALNLLSNRMHYLEERMNTVEQSWEKLLNVVVLGFRMNKCPTGWMPVSNADALLLTGPNGANVSLLLKGTDGEIVPRQGMAEGIAAQKILFCIRSNMR
ncbi:hypothetical protein PJ900_12240 [Tistrella mobilis]|uniref:Uncharacterized protein n=1 Tax=Tistrella mobilis TaxID=171437 RepID=A0A162LAI0_9PROT|nr:hypothetical protein [Tistrella mobilis]KYO54146.1 hypothetical protein AUP44_25560 [Tistrella mobilis]